ncbi:hypothetical protein DE146DRAFT_735981 [Phaeosphaeria sp. MPI-PUGE-AT-0046c]|nr:hypothetical protein DE146DRAFT_735981 [Phaeosphaeria sp. MPI-PUGE-AT-0046c]
MPPPLLLRHTRPCRPPWSAHLVRYASSTSQNPVSTGDDSFARLSDADTSIRGPQQSASEHVAGDTIQAGHTRRSLWSAALHGITPFVSNDTSPPSLESIQRPSQDEPSARPSTLEESGSPENATSLDIRPPQMHIPAAGADAVQKHQELEANPAFPIRRMVLSKTSKYNPAVHRRLQQLSERLDQTKSAQKSKLLRKATLSQQSQHAMNSDLRPRDRRAVFGRTVKSDSTHDRAAHMSKVSQQDEPVQQRSLFRKVKTLEPPEPEMNDTTSVLQRLDKMTPVKHDQPAQEPVGGPALETIQRQLKELAEQVKMMKHTLNAMTTKFESSLTHPVEAAVPQDKQNVTGAPSRAAHIGQPGTISSPTLLRPAVEAARLGHGVYRSSTIALANIVKSFETAPSLTTVEIDKRIRARLATIAQQAAREEDQSIRRALLAICDSVGRASATESDQTINSCVDGDDRAQVNSDHVKEERHEPTLQHSRSTTSPSHADGHSSTAHSYKRRNDTPPPSSFPSPATRIRSEGTSSVIKGLPHQKPPTSAPDASEQSLLDELFPEANAPVSPEPVKDRDQYPKLEPPSSERLIRPETVGPPKGAKQQMVESFLRSGEDITVLQLQHCSTELTESDFRRLIPKGKHIEAWNRDGAYYKVIPGRNPISLERLPFYYILFKSPESAYAYQNNVTRLHKLAALHQPTNIFSAIPAPRGFLEDGEDVDAVTSSYLLRPTEHAPAIRTLMQPYHPGLRSLFTQGGYTPIMPDADDKRNRIYKVLMHIEGYEPSFSDLFTVFRRDAASRGLPLPLRNESITSLHRLRDLVNLKTHVIPIATTNPRAYDTARSEAVDGSASIDTKIDYDDPNIAYFMKNDEPLDRNNAKEINQIIMNQVYNRWILEFDDEDEARRFAIAWHRRALPELSKTERTWKDYEEARMCNTELLW